MRTRLIIVFLVPMTVILLALGGAYAWSVARSVQQETASQQLQDLSYFLTGARQALITENPGLVEGELRRYSELYDTTIAIYDRSGAVWASGGEASESATESVATRISLALSGRRSEAAPAVLPWALGEMVVVEPVFDDGSVIGAVMITETADGPRDEILAHWVLLVVAMVVIIALLVYAVLRLANWVLRPMLRVDQAMIAIEHGEMDARIADDTGPPEMRSMIRIFNQMADEIERVMSRQKEFALNASHELRNPLGALLLRVETLATGLDESWQGDVEKTREEGKRMSRILDTMLSMARAGQQDTSFAAVDLVQLVAGRAAAWREVAAERGVRFEQRGEQQPWSVTDRTSLESALDAVIDNALKFAPEGTAIELMVSRADGMGCITVSDRGPGLTTEELERATHRFWRSSRDQNVPGSGLGLAIASDLLDALHGELAVVNAEHGGLSVTLKLPAGEAS